MESNPICIICKAERRLGAFSKVNFLSLLRYCGYVRCYCGAVGWRDTETSCTIFWNFYVSLKLFQALKTGHILLKMVSKLGQTVEYWTVVGMTDSLLCASAGILGAYGEGKSWDRVWNINSKDSKEVQVLRSTSKQTATERKARVWGLWVEEGRRGGKPPGASEILEGRCVCSWWWPFLSMFLIPPLTGQRDAMQKKLPSGVARSRLIEPIFSYHLRNVWCPRTEYP